MRKITFTTDAFSEYNEWIVEDIDIVQKIILLLKDIQNNPFNGWHIRLRPHCNRLGTGG